MNYHLRNLQGQDLGVFPLDELRRRRAAGALTGSEHVWCEGLANWELLDSVLQSRTSGNPHLPPPAIPPVPRKKNPVLTVAIVAGILLILVGAICVGIAVLKVVKHAQPVLERITSRSAPFVGEADSADEASVVAIASKPVVWNTNTLSAADVRNKDREFRVRQYLEGYKKFGKRDSSVDAESLRLIESWIAFNFGTASEKTNTPPLSELSDRLVADPACTDPLVLTIAAVQAVELHEAIRRLERAVSGFEQSPYPAYPKFYATVLLAEKLIRDKSDRQPVLDAAAKRRLQEALEDGSLLPKDQDVMAELLIMGWGSRFFDRNAAAIHPIAAAAGDSFKWLALVLEGEFEIQEAWRARGGGYADSVSDKGWEGFRNHLAKARKCLTEAWQLHPELPLAAGRMIYVSLGDSGIEEMRLWFDRAVAAQIDYSKAWSDLRWGLRPRWYGSQEAMLAFGVTAANTRRFDTDVPRILFDAINDLESELELPRGQHIFGREDVWPHLQGMYEGYIAEPSEAESRNGWRSTYSAIAYLAKKYDVAKTQLELLNWKPQRFNLTGWGTDLSLMNLEVAARTGPLGPEITKAESARNKGDSAAALQGYLAMKNAVNADASTRAFVEDRLVTLEIERGLQAGEWVDFLPKEDQFPGWCIERGKCQRLADGALEVQSGKDGHILYSRVRMGMDFEVRGEIEAVQSSTTAFQGGLVIGLPEPDSRAWDGFRLKRNNDEGDLAAFAQGWSKKQVYQPIKLNDSTNSFYLRFRPDKISARVNGQPVFSDVKPPANANLSTNEIYLGLGAFNDMNDTVIRYRNIQVRKASDN